MAADRKRIRLGCWVLALPASRAAAATARTSGLSCLGLGPLSGLRASTNGCAGVRLDASPAYSPGAAASGALPLMGFVADRMVTDGCAAQSAVAGHILTCRPFSVLRG